MLKFIDRGGSYHNYYMWFGGNHYGRWAGNGIPNWYTNGVMIHSDTLPNEPKHAHTAKLHHAVAAMANVVVHDEAKVNQQVHLNCDSCFAFEYRYEDQEVIFLENNKDDHDVLIYRDMMYEMEPKSIVVIDETNNVLFATHELVKVNKHRVYHKQETLQFTYWNEPLENLEGAGMRVIVSPKANEQLNMTRDLTEFLYYETKVTLPKEECQLAIGGTDANAFVAFLDGKKMGADDQHYHTDGWHTMYIPVQGTPGEHTLTILSESLGICNIMDADQDPTWASQRLKGICGWVKLCDQDIFTQTWRHYPGLAGEALQVFTEEGAKKVEWKSDVKNAAPLAWYRASFKTPACLKRGVQVLFRPEGMNRGQAYVNGNPLGRYWMIRDKDNDFTQGYYHIPKDWLQPEGEENWIYLGETLGADEPNVTIYTTEYVAIQE